MLICQPVGQEYFRCHRTIKLLADNLANSGFHVLRFDYSGTGDSYGNFSNSTILKWHGDIQTAFQELLDISFAQKISVIGLRFGALLSATNFLDKNYSLENMVLWEPIVNGKIYLDELRLMQSQCFPLKSINSNEIFGFLYSHELLKEIENCNIPLCKIPQINNTHLIFSDERSDLNSFSQMDFVKKNIVQEQGDWLNPIHYDHAFLASETIFLIQKLLKGKLS